MIEKENVKWWMPIHIASAQLLTTEIVTFTYFINYGEGMVVGQYYIVNSTLKDRNL